MFRLDTLSCALTVLSTVLVGRKLSSGFHPTTAKPGASEAPGLVVAGVSSVVICIIGLRTAQVGFIPAICFVLGFMR
jgi:hypothetical protein